MRIIIRYFKRMEDIYALTDKAILLTIGHKLKEARLEQNLSQKDVSAASGLSMFSISQMENGHNTSMLSLIMVLRSLNRLDLLNAMLEEHPVSPIALSEYAKRHPERKRACNSKKETASMDFGWDDGKEIMP